MRWIGSFRSSLSIQSQRLTTGPSCEPRHCFLPALGHAVSRRWDQATPTARKSGGIDVSQQAWDSSRRRPNPPIAAQGISTRARRRRATCGVMAFHRDRSPRSAHNSRSAGTRFSRARTLTSLPLSGHWRSLFPASSVEPPRRNSVTVTNPTWLGTVTHATGSQAFTWVLGQWNVPDLAPAPGGGGRYAFAFIGIDGNMDVTQIGTIQSVSTAANGGVSKSCYAVYEWYPIPGSRSRTFRSASGTP